MAKRREGEVLSEEFRRVLLKKLEENESSMKDQTAQLSSISGRLKEFERTVTGLVKDVAVIQVKAGVWGAAGAVLTLAAAWLMKAAFR